MGALLNRRRYMGGSNGGEEPLPQGAVRVEYIESTGAQRIKTGVMVSQIARYSTKMLITNSGSAKAEGSTATNNWFFIGANAQNKFYAALGSTLVTSNVSNDQEFHQFDLDTTTGYFSIDGVQTSYLRNGKINSSIHFALFCCNGVGGNDNQFLYYITGKKAETQIYGDNGELLADYIPCRIDQIGYMYDRVSGNFYRSGTGTPFSPGPDKT